jgi:hypothetical protein
MISNTPSIFFPSVSVMGLARPSELIATQISSQVLPAHSLHMNAPKARFNKFIAGMGIDAGDDAMLRGDGFREFEGFERSASREKLVRLGQAVFFKKVKDNIDREDARQEYIHAAGISALLYAELEMRTAVIDTEAEDSGWFTGAGVFSNICGEEGLALIALYAMCKRPVEGTAEEILTGENIRMKAKLNLRDGRYQTWITDGPDIWIDWSKHLDAVAP